ncbi:Glycosyl transferase family 2 [Acetitomaculum ruminis DSM 5522]|uniref:Glycosyl transferase family 2 n=1 Tax=Acetitomaculum ruminis DSM 5522 TaxID=1120918 RepID=A0A1I0VKX5_9FIRM|nr:glycosyltransferase [Acetitomaculum ruminis]SFA76540.1 Glycosyl transferase family 2 [Acetitomaculum ruminis DSM 5522]
MPIDKENRFLVSIIVPVFKVDKKLVEKCIKSIISQTYKNLQIILVDDGNEPDYSADLKDFLSMDSRIRYVKHDKNQGLFRARLSGFMEAKGEYIAFVDADDFITIDWIRLLLKKALEGNFDIVMAKTVCIDNKGWEYIYNTNISRCRYNSLYGKDVFEFFLKDCGLDFSIHTIWNKIYKRELFENAYNDLDATKNHITMTEDILYSFILFFYAKSIGFSDHEGYMYYRNEKSSTKEKGDSKKVIKNISDILYVFTRIKDFLLKKKCLEKYELFFNQWSDRYFRWWSSFLEKFENEIDGDFKNNFFKAFNKNKVEKAFFEDGYFEQKKTSWDSSLEHIKKAIVSDKIKAVSFDLFDTLILRYVLNPDDIFRIVLMETDIYPYEEEVLFRYRKMSEEICRKRIQQEFPEYEDVTLSEIYDTFSEYFGVNKKLTGILMEKETAFEKHFSSRRNTGFELYELAITSHKDVFISSDMYLELKDVIEILDKNGYYGYKGIYLSSDRRLLKKTGHLYDLILEENGLTASQIIHIGDNIDSDSKASKEKNIKSFILTSTKDVLTNKMPGKYKGNSVKGVFKNYNSIIDINQAKNNLSMRCLYATAANILFDNPFIPVNEDSDYNGDPFFLGTLALGMHMFGIIKWLYEKMKELKKDTLHFSSRDGFYLKELYESFYKKINGDIPKTNYLYLSRKSLIPVEISQQEFVDAIFVSCNYKANSPESVIERYIDVLEPLTPQLKEFYESEGFLTDEVFKSEKEFASFIRLLKKYQYSPVKANISFENCKNYLESKINENDLIFDLGYSGKLQKSIIKAMNKSVSFAFLNNSGYEALMRIKKNELQVISYFDYVPSISGIVNEYIFSDRNPSCISYEKKADEVMPVLEKKRNDFIGDYVVDQLQYAAKNFNNKFMDYYSEYLNIIQVNPAEYSAQYEKYLINPKKFDQAIFDYCKIEDEYYGGISQKELNEIWNWYLDSKNYRIEENSLKSRIEDSENINYEYEVYLKNVHKKGLISKGLYWFLVDRSFFKKRLFEHFFNKKDS